MPLWDAFLGIAGSGVIFVGRMTPIFFSRKVGATKIAVPKEYDKIFRKVAKQIGLKNSDKVQLYIKKGLSSSSMGTTWAPGGAYVGLAEFYGTRKGELASSDHINIDLLSEDGRKIKKFYTATDNKVKFTIGHELVHFKYNDEFLDGIRMSAWYFITVYPLTEMVNLMVGDGLSHVMAIAPMWCASFLLWRRCEKYMFWKQEFRADRLSAQTDLKAALGGIEALNDRLVFQKIYRKYDDKNVNKIAEDGEMLSNTHPPFKKRIKALEAIVEEHKKKISKKKKEV